MFDASSGVYPVDGQVAGSVTGTQGQYALSWTKRGLGNTRLLMFALPHHVQSFDNTTRSHQQGFQLTTTTKGKATAVMADSWTMVEPNLTIDMGFAPWKPGGHVSPLSSSQKATIQSIATNEAAQNMDQEINANTDSMYFSGKRASKYATLVYTMHDLLQDPGGPAALTKLKNAVARVINNTQKFPLVYETAWKGVVSSGPYTTGNPIQDFGITYYNDHHL